MSIQQLLLAEAANPKGTIDAYTTNLWGAYSISKVLSTASACIDAINTGTATTATIGFNTSGGMDTGALATLAAGGSVAVSSFINQQGTTARNFGASSNALRPDVVLSGVIQPGVIFNGSSDGMVTGANSGTPSAMTVFLRGKLRSTGTMILMEQSTNYNNGAFCAAPYDAGSMQVGIHSGASASANYGVSQFNAKPPNDDVQMWRFDRSQTLGPLSTRLAVNGVLQTRTGNADAGTMGGTFTAAPWYLGARAQASLFSPLNVHTLLIYEGAVSDADCAAISTILAAL